jgi:hypothetical protein
MQLLIRSFFLSLTIGVLSPWSVRAGSKQDISITPPAAPKSEFIDDVEFGKDPFFPKSTRRPKIIAKSTDPEPLKPTVPDFIVLKGISVAKDKKLAIINNYTVSEGEEFSLKSGAAPVKIKCIEIKEKSVIVSVNGATKELPLRSGF